MIRLAVFIWLIGTSHLSAQTIDVQTGEHAEFSRVVLITAPDAEWRIGRVSDGYGIVIDGAGSFDLDGFYDLIPRDRIEEVTVSEDGELLLRVTCDCAVVPFRDTPRILVVDIMDGAPDPGSPFEAPLRADEAEQLAQLQPSEDIVVPQPRLNLGLMPEFPMPEVLQRAPLAPSPAELQERTARRQDVGALEAAVIESLSRAASQGLLELRDDLQVNVQPADDAENQDIAADFMPPDEPERGQIRPGITANTTVDIGLAGVFDDEGLVSQLLSCWPDDQLTVSDWAVGEDFNTELAAHRRAITAEFDVVDPDAIESLARFYLYHGFGREAAQTLEIDGGNSRDRSIIRSLAELIDNDPLTDRSLLGMTTCPGKAALWAVLATDQENLTGTIDEAQVARDFKLLPDGLQVLLSPRLARRILDLDAPDVAETVLAPRMDSGVAPEEGAMVSSAIARERGDLAEAARTLQDIALTEAHTTPEALTELIQLHLDQDLTLASDILARAETVLFEFGKTERTERLAAAMVRGELQNEMFRAADSFLKAEADRFGNDLSAGLRREMLSRISADADDATFIELVFQNDFGAVEPGLGNSVASRLLTLGFPERAEAFLQAPALGDAMTERRYLRAQVAAAQGDYALAQSHLAGVTSERARRILSFGPEGIPLRVNAASDMPDAEDLAWRNGDWTGLAASEDPLLRDVSELVLENQVPPPDPVAPLARGRALADAAGQTRETLDALMNRFEAPVLEGGS